MLARNRNILSFGLVAALVSGFSSCTEVPVDTQQLVNHQVHDEYVANFVAKYGQPSPNQSWDFSGRDMNNADEDILPCIEPETRAISSAAVVLNEWEDPSDERMVIGYLPAVSTYNEFAWIRDNVASGELKEWEPNIFGVHDLWVYYIHGNGSDYSNYTIGVHASAPWTTDVRNGSYPDEHVIYGPISGGTSGTSWAYGNGYRYNGTRLNSRAFENSFNDEFPDWIKEIDEDDYWGWSTFLGYDVPDDWNYVEELSTEKEFFWFAMDENPDNVFYRVGLGPSEERDALIERYRLKYYRELVTPYGALYWCFDCDHDGDYSDLICLVEPTTVKRYMIEDLGALDDFDFNDIVVDVAATNRVNQETGEVTTYQKAYLRAMGGTLDFTLTIGNTKWSKSGNNYDPTIAVNADAGTDNTALIAEFPVEGWDPDANNISVTVKRKKGDSSGDEVYISFPFPKAGEVPMIIALLPSQYLDTGETPRRYWMPERVSIPAKYFTEESTTEP